MINEVVDDESLPVRPQSYAHRHDNALSLEESLRYEVLESINAQLIVLDSEFTIIYANQSWHEVVRDAGITFETIGTDYLKLLSRIQQLYRDQIDEVIRSIYSVRDKSIEHFEADYFIHSGKVFDRLKLRIQRIHFNSEDRLLVSHDLVSNEYVAVPEQLDASELMVHGVAHTFNDLLAAIKVNCELLEREVNTNIRAADILKRIFSSIRSATNLTQQLLSSSQINNAPLQEIQFNEIIEQVVRSTRAGRPTTIEVKTDIDSSGMLGDPLQLSQLLEHLFENSIEAIGENPGTITITLNCIEPSKNKQEAPGQEPFLTHIDRSSTSRYAHLRFADDGRGMDDKTLHRCFDPFYTTQSFGSNSGLGLYVVRRIVMNLGGRVIVTSKLGEGTTFDVYLPIATQTITS